MKKINCVLLIDDSRPDNYFHKKIIDDSETTTVVRVAENGLEGLDYLNNTGKFSDEEENPKPQIIFLDINMPKMNGFEFLDEYQQLDEGLKAEQCIMMLTTSINPKDKEKAESYAGLSGFASKPLIAETLKKIIEERF